MLFTLSVCFSFLSATGQFRGITDVSAHDVSLFAGIRQERERGKSLFICYIYLSIKLPCNIYYIPLLYGEIKLLPV